MARQQILLVDDDPVFARGASSLLRNEGFEVLVAQDGAGTVNVLRQGSKPDLILMDILIPVDAEQAGVSWDGFATMDWLRCVGANQAPVILLTAGDQAVYVERARKAGALALFQKTVETADLVGVIHQLLD